MDDLQPGKYGSFSNAFAKVEGRARVFHPHASLTPQSLFAPALIHMREGNSHACGYRDREPAPNYPQNQAQRPHSMPRLRAGLLANQLVVRLINDASRHIAAVLYDGDDFANDTFRQPDPPSQCGDWCSSPIDKS